MHADIVVVETLLDNSKRWRASTIVPTSRGRSTIIAHAETPESALVLLRAKEFKVAGNRCPKCGESLEMDATVDNCLCGSDDLVTLPQQEQ